jgi:D-isomer specific 2-hydroxyacid dehydrogenase-like protein
LPRRIAPVAPATSIPFEAAKAHWDRRYVLATGLFADSMTTSLLKALDEGMIGGAGLDVTDPEPLPAELRLWNHPRAIVTPHTAGGSPRRAGRVIETRGADVSAGSSEG